jgi:hypothetical protein
MDAGNDATGGRAEQGGKTYAAKLAEMASVHFGLPGPGGAPGHQKGPARNRVQRGLFDPERVWSLRAALHVLDERAQILRLAGQIAHGLG